MGLVGEGLWGSLAISCIQHGTEEKLQRSGAAPIICLNLVLKLTIGQEVVRRIKSINLRKKSWDFAINM